MFSLTPCLFLALQVFYRAESNSKVFHERINSAFVILVPEFNGISVSTGFEHDKIFLGQSPIDKGR